MVSSSVGQCGNNASIVTNHVWSCSTVHRASCTRMSLEISPVQCLCLCGASYVHCATLSVALCHPLHGDHCIVLRHAVYRNTQTYSSRTDQCLVLDAFRANGIPSTPTCGKLIALIPVSVPYRCINPLLGNAIIYGEIRRERKELVCILVCTLPCILSDSVH